MVVEWQNGKKICCFMLTWDVFRPIAVLLMGSVSLLLLQTLFWVDTRVWNRCPILVSNCVYYPYQPVCALEKSLKKKKKLYFKEGPASLLWEKSLTRCALDSSAMEIVTAQKGSIFSFKECTHFVVQIHLQILYLLSFVSKM